MKKMLFKHLRRAIALALVIMLALTSTGCMAAYLVSEVVDPEAALFGGAKQAEASSEAVASGTSLEEPAVAAYREGVPLSEITYVRPDTAKIYTAIDALNALLDAGDTDGEKLVADYEAILNLFDEISTAACVAYYYHALDVTDTYYEAQYNELSELEYDVDVILGDLSIRLYEYPATAELMNTSYSARYKEVCYLTPQLNSDAIRPYTTRESELVTKYETLLSTFSFEDNGKTYTQDDLFGIADSGEYSRLVTAYFEALNAAAGEIYDELLEVRSAIASEFGYASYAEYAYKTLLRSYTPEDVRPLYEAVKEYIVPLYKDKTLKYYLGNDSDIADSFSVDRELFIRQLRCVLNGAYSDNLEALDQLLALGNWYSEPGENRMQSEFTLSFANLKTSCICTFWEGNPASATTFTHELGHYTRGYLTAGAHDWSSTEELDLDEMDSQCLQFLLIPQYETFFGSAADSVARSSLLDALYSIVVGCMEDEFQQEVYANPSMTNAERNELYGRLADEYGMKALFGYTGTEWTTIPHTFQSPMYYISYAVSVIPVLELLSMAEEDPAGAAEIYAKLLHRGEDASFRETVQSLGLSDPLSPDTVKAVAKAVKGMF